MLYRTKIGAPGGIGRSSAPPFLTCIRMADDKTLEQRKAVTPTTGANGSNGAAKKAARLPVMKTYKIFIGGKFPRTESGRY